MRPVTLLSVALFGLLFAAAPAGATPPSGAPARPQTTAPAPAQTAPVTRPPAPGIRTPERRRRPSYASCNRESHRRKLFGGARRRFLVRCRLGYEKRPFTQQAPARKP